jgi:outer membrane lipoprotein-sorting protein
VSIGSFLVLAISFAMGADSSTAKLTANQIVEKNVQARGGLQAWRNVQTMLLSGKLQAGGNERANAPALPVSTAGVKMPERRPSEQVQLPFRMELKRARKSRMEIDFRSQTAVQVYDGVSGWKLRPFLNRHEVEPYSAEEMKAAALQSDLDGPLVDYAAKGTKIELEGTDKVDGRDTYRLKLTYKNGQSQHLWIDAQTFLETKMEGTPRRLDGKYHNVELFYRDYRSVNGLMLPYLLETKVQGVAQAEKIEIEKVAVNPKLEDSRFAKPQ